jgi:hypothetical protein
LRRIEGALTNKPAATISVTTSWVPQHSLDEELYRRTDGFTSRYYTSAQFEDLFRAFFDEVSLFICGQDAGRAAITSANTKIYALNMFSEERLTKCKLFEAALFYLPQILKCDDLHVVYTRYNKRVTIRLPGAPLRGTEV